MKFKIDENLPVEAAESLRQMGYEATTVLEQGLGGGADARIAGPRPIPCLIESQQRYGII
jgi:predicted nuclease of predicted toxin-antitoxin system